MLNPPTASGTRTSPPVIPRFRWNVERGRCSYSKRSSMPSSNCRAEEPEKSSKTNYAPSTACSAGAGAWTSETSGHRCHPAQSALTLKLIFLGYSRLTIPVPRMTLPDGTAPRLNRRLSELLPDSIFERNLKKEEESIGHRQRGISPDDGFRKAVHLFRLRAELQQHEVNAGGFELGHPLGHLFGRADKPRTQAAIRNRIIFQRNALLQLRSGQPLLVIRVARRGLLHVGDSPQLILRFALRFANDRISGNAELERRQIVPCAAFPHIRDFLAHALGRIAVHQISVALLGDQLFCRRRFAARVQRWPRFRSRFWLEHIIFNTIILSRKRKMVLLPDSIQNVEPFAGPRVAVVMLFERHAIFACFVCPPRGDHVQSEPPIADLIDVGGLFRQQRGQMKRWPHRHHQFNSLRHCGQRRRG